MLIKSRNSLIRIVHQLRHLCTERLEESRHQRDIWIYLVQLPQSMFLCADSTDGCWRRRDPSKVCLWLSLSHIIPIKWPFFSGPNFQTHHDTSFENLSGNSLENSLQEAIKFYKRVLDLRPGDYECTLSNLAMDCPSMVTCDHQTRWKTKDIHTRRTPQIGWLMININGI